MNWGPRPILVVLAGFLAAGLGFAGSGSASIGAPTPIGPRSGAVVPELPTFAWRAVSSADHYEFQLAADSGFRSPVFTLRTWNTRATMTRMITNGTYWWRVRGVSKSGDVSAWSSARSVRKAWSSVPHLQAPIRGARVNFPSTPLTLTWTPVPRAAKYLVALATDESLSSLVGDRPIETAATTLTPPLTPGGKSKVYYWAVTPVDAAGNKGAQSRVERFTWLWPSTTHVRLTDLRPEPETIDPQFSWNAVPGAARYEVEINSSRDFAPGSRVCCERPVVGTTFSPTRVFADNTYYWRVRAIDVKGNSGVWNPSDPNTSPFVKVFDKESTLGRPSISNLHMRDNLNDPAPPGATRVPIVVWDPVPGASEYFLQVAPFDGRFCNWQAARGSGWEGKTPNVTWTPLARPREKEPFPAGMGPRSETPLRPGTYCVRVRAISDIDTQGAVVYGDFAYVGGGDDRAAFSYAGPPCPTSCGGARHLGQGDYVVGSGVKTTKSPLLTWRSSAGAAWWVLVARDPQFHSVVDYVFVDVPAYAPRITYSDETTSYYWTVLPAELPTGGRASGDPLGGPAAAFDKRSIAPILLAPAARSTVTLAPVFHWRPVEGALRYRFQVSRDKDFGTLLDDVETDSTAYTSNTSYPPDVALFWRVRAEDAGKVGLSWSEQRTFTYRLGAPKAVSRPATADLIPTFRWRQAAGAISYDFHIDYPNGGSNDASEVPSPAVTAVVFSGPGVWHWKVRANFPSDRGNVHGPWSRQIPFTKTIGTPTGLQAQPSSRGLSVSWAPKLGAATYSVQVSSTPDFSRSVGVTTDLTSWAPESRPEKGRHGFYWRVAARDTGGNQGDWSVVRRFRW